MATLNGFGESLLDPVHGKLNTDTQPSKLPMGDYIDAYGITAVSQGANTETAYMPYISDKYAYTDGAVVVQNKVIQVTIDCTKPTASQQVNVFDVNGNNIGNIIFTLTNGDTATTITAFETQFSAQLISGFPSITYTQVGTVLNTTAIVQITLTDVMGYDWNIISASSAVTVQILQEAIDLSMTGESQIIASRQDSSKTTEFIMSTPCQFLPTIVGGTIGTIYVSGTSNVVAALIRIQTNVAHGLTTGYSVVISGVLGTTEANGIWIINVIDSTHFDLQHSVYVHAYSSSPLSFITQYANGYGKIGVAVKDINAGTWTYTDLCRAKKFNFRTLWQIDLVLQVDNSGFDLKWCDFNNIDRVWYYNVNEPFITDGAMAVVNPLGKYNYDTIDGETALILNSDVGILTFTSQTVGGGAVGSGNWRYGVRGVAFGGLDTSSVTYMDILVPVYQAPQNLGGVTPLNLCGDDSTQFNVPSSKINNFTLSNIPDGVYEYVELIGTQYVGISETTYVITRLLLPVGQTSFDFSHIGNETDTVLLASAEVSVINNIPDTSRNMRYIQNRLDRSNLKVGAAYDLSVFAKSVKWNVKREQLQGVGLGSGKDTGDYIYYGEYFVPENVNSHRSFMINETMRMAMICHKKTGGWTDAYYCGDVKIDVIAAGLSYDLTTSATDNTQIYSYYLDPYGFNLNFVLSDGRLFRDVYDRIEFCQVPITSDNATILGSGLAVLGNESIVYSPDGATANYEGEVIANYGIGTLKRGVGSFYFADCIWGNENISFVNGDKIINFGQPAINKYTVTPAGKNNPDILWEFNGYTNQTSNTHVQTVAIQALMTLLSEGNAANFNGTGKTYSKNKTAALSAFKESMPTSLIYGVGTNITDGNQAGNPDSYYYMCQYYRPKTNQYGNSIYGNTYVTTGAVYYITPQSPTIIPTGTIKVHGDCFTQKSYLRQQRGLTVGNADQTAVGIGCYGQNRINQQMRFVGSPSGLLFPVGVCTVSIWLENPDAEPINYNQGYTPRQQDQTEPAYDPNNPVIQLLPTRHQYSLARANDNRVDLNRTFLPLNFYDQDESNGAITHMEILNGELIAWQPTAITHLFFNTTGKFQIGNAGDIITGDGGTLTRTPATLSKIGCNNKWAVIKGQSENGDDTACWIDTRLNLVMRYAGDGIRCLSQIAKAANFFANNLRFAGLYDTPAHGEGIHGVFHQLYEEYIFVMRGHKQVDGYLGGTTYAINAEVNYGTSTFNATPDIYVSLQNANTGHTPSSNPTWWKKIDHSDNRYYNEYSIAYSEKKKGFVSKYIPLPKIFLKFNDGYLYPKPISNLGLVYEALQGNSYLSFYDGALTVDGSISFVVNHSGSEMKRFLSVMVQCKVVPYRIDFTTENATTYTLYTDEWDFEFQKFWSAIQQDLNTGNGQRNGTGDDIFGLYCIVKFWFQSGQYNQLQDFFVKTNPSAPMPNS